MLSNSSKKKTLAACVVTETLMVLPPSGEMLVHGESNQKPTSLLCECAVRQNGCNYLKSVNLINEEGRERKKVILLLIF